MQTRKNPISCGITPSEKPKFRFRREEHLKGRNEIRKVFSEGKRYYCQGAKLFAVKNNLPHNRICFTLSKGFANAVARNRARRLSREAFRLLKARSYGGYDLILLINPETGMALSDRLKQLTALFSKAGILT